MTGLPPFTGANKEVQSLAQEGNLQPAFERLDRCSQDEKLVNLAKCCLAPNPGDRLADAGQVAAAVRSYLDGVQERLRRAELQRAQAEVKGAEERKRRRVVVGLAAAILLLVLGVSGVAFWYLQNKALAEQDMRQNLNLAQETHVELVEELKKPGGVRGLLNQRFSRWELQIQTARAAWQRAKDRADNAQGNLDPELLDLLGKLDGDLARDQHDYELAWRLEKIRLDTATLIERKPLSAPLKLQYPQAFAEAGLPLEPGQVKETAALIQQSVIKEQLLATLEDWALHANDLLRKRLLEAIALADPDPGVNRVRKLAFSNNLAAIEKLADELQRDQGLLRRLSPSMVILLGERLPQAKQESWMRVGQTLYPTDFWLNFQVAVFFSKKDRPSEAIAYYFAALAIRPNSAAVYNNLGLAFHDLKNLPAAVEAYKKALAIDNKDSRTWYHLGLALRDQKNLPAAIDAFKKALAIDDRLAVAWHNLGIVQAQQQNLPATIAAFKKAVAIDDKYTAAWNNLGNALRDQKNLPAAIDAFKKALAIDDKHAAAWNNLGNALREQKNLPAAIDAHKKALAIDDKLAVAWHNLGIVLAQQKNLPAAIDAFKKALAIDDKFASAWNYLGTVLRDQKKLPPAIDAFKKALAIDDRYAEAWNNLGVALYAQKNLPAAIDAYKKSLAIDPKYAMAWYNFGNAVRDKKNLPAAIDAYQKAIRLDPDLAEPHCNLGLVLERAGDFAAALKALQKGDELGRRQPGWPYPSAAWVQHCQQLLTLEQKLPAVLEGGPAEAGELLALADMCQRYKKRYRDSAALFGKAFAKQPRAAENLNKAYRYNAACAAARAAAGKGIGADKLDLKEKTGLRQQALQWLQADLAARTRFLEKNPFLALRIQDDMNHWQRDPDLAGLRDEKELAKLAQERAAWQKLWTEVAALSKQARAAFSQTEYQGRLSDKEREQSHPLKMTAGKTYMIDMTSAEFDTYLRLEDDKGKVLAENDDISPQNSNSRIGFPCKQDGSYRIVATSFQHAGRGAYVLIIREFTSKK